MGYFIEEAREHLQTIEQGVLNLQDILDEPESINELFRAAHSIKGGAAMLGVGSIQHVAHRLEDFFKILKENPKINVDERLKSLLLAGFDPLAELLDELQIGFRISDELTLETSNRVKPVFAELESYLNQLTANSNEQVVTPVLADQKSEQRIVEPKPVTSQKTIFQEEVTNKMRDMLQLFRGADSQESRSQLQEICSYFQEVGDRFELSNWTSLATQIKNAIAYSINSYRTLAPIVIRELKDAQDLVLANREAEIAISPQIQNLLPYRFSESEDDDVSTIFTTAPDISPKATNIEEDLQLDVLGSEEGTEEYEVLDLASINPVDQQSPNEDVIDLFSDQEEQEEAFDLLEIPQEQIDQMDWMDSEYEITENQHIDGPKVGASELKSLATLFENDDIDFDSAWEDIESNESNLAKHGNEQNINNNHDEFADLLDNTSTDLNASNRGLEDSNLVELFGDGSTSEQTSNIQDSQGLFSKDQDSQGLFPDDMDITSNPTDQLLTKNTLDSLKDLAIDDLVKEETLDTEFDDFDLGIDIIDQISDMTTENAEVMNAEVINIDDLDFSEGSPQESSELLSESTLSDAQDDDNSLSSEEYFAELARQENVISNGLHENLEEAPDTNNHEPFALTISEEDMALLEEDPFAINDNLDADLLETPLNISNEDQNDFGLSNLEDFANTSSPKDVTESYTLPIESSEDFDTNDTSGLNIFDELGFDNDDFEQEVVSPVTDHPAIDHNDDKGEEAVFPDNNEFDKIANSISSDDVSEFDAFLESPTANELDVDFGGFNNIADININEQPINELNEQTDEIDDLFADAPETSSPDEIIASADDLQFFGEDSSNAVSTDDLGDFFGNEESVDQELSTTDDLGDFFDNEESVEQELSTTDDLGDFFGNEEELSQEINTGNEELGDFFTDVEASDFSLSNDISNSAISDIPDNDNSIQDISIQDIGNTDELGDFFADAEEPDLDSVYSENKPNHLSTTDDIDGLGDFFNVSESPEDLAENLLDDNWSDLGLSDDANINDDVAGETIDSFADGDLDSDFGDISAKSSSLESSLESINDKLFNQIEEPQSANKSDNLVNLFANANEDDLTILENNFNDFGNDLDNEFDFNEERSLTQSDASSLSDDFEENNFFDAINDLQSDSLQSNDEPLTSIQQDDVVFDDDQEDITASSTIDSLVDFFQGDDDSDITDLTTSDSVTNSNNDSFDDNQDLDFGGFDEMSDLNGSSLQDSVNSETDYLERRNLAIDNQSVVEELNGIDDNFDFDDLEAMIGDSNGSSNNLVTTNNDGFANSDNRRNQDHGQQSINSDDMNFDELEALLGDTGSFDIPVDKPKEKETANITASATRPKDDFDELENMLQSRFAQDVGPIKTKTPVRPPVTTRRPKLSDSTMRVDVKYLDSLNNLVGELVVNRNLLEQEQERLQQFITNLLHQVQLLSDVSQRMRDQYDRSLLEASLTAGRGRSFNNFESSYSSDGASSSSNVSSDFEGIEFDRYNTFHVLSQEIIELIVKVRESASDIEFVVGETDQVTRQLGTITTQVQDDLKQSRMVPFAQIADRLPRGIRDRALKSGKQADLEVFGRETLIDKAILESLTDPLTHLVNNAIDHGLEDPATRQAAGKSATGKLTVRAYHQGNQTVISISDDGAGISTEKVKKSAVAKGVRSQSEVDRLNDTEVYSLLFEAGFSTAAEADEFKGRGVGLDVVKTCLDEIRGVIIVESAVGKGTTFTIRLPLTLSISKAMFCISDRARIAFPVDGFEDMVEVPQSQIVLNEKGQPCLPWRDTVLPFQHLSNLLSYSRHLSRSNIYGKQDNDELCIIILRNDTSYLALQVDQFLGEYEIVIKQLEGPIPQPAGIAGATVLGDGRVMAIANVLELFDIASGRLRPSTSGVTLQPPIEEDVAVDPTVLIVDDSITVRELLSLTFAKVGYRVEQAKDGQDAWEKLRAGLPCDMIFCDIEMPRMDGLDLLSRLQKDARLKDIPVAMLTSRGADRHRQTAIQLGAKGYFTKPYLEEELLSASKRLLNGETLPI
jgi:chemosensory pili system protein ChpA (sensor histidine kinase/response regulator)